MKTPVTLRVYKIKNSSSIRSMLRHRYFCFELHFQLEIDFEQLLSNLRDGLLKELQSV